MKFQRNILARLLALALGTAGAGEVLAATRYFDCASGNMQTASCWSSNIKPVAGDNAYIGYSSYPTAVTATLNSSSFAATNEYVGNGATAGGIGYQGIVNHSAGSNTVSNALYVGYHQTGDFGGGSIYYGVYNLSGTASLTTFKTDVGYNTYGTINQSGGTHTVSTNLSLGRVNDALGSGGGTYSITGGTLNVNNSITTGAGWGSLQISGGTVNVVGSIVGGTGNSHLYLSGTGILNVGGGNGSIDVEVFALGDAGTHTLSGSGSINTTYSSIKGQVGGAATFTQTGGSHSSFYSIVGGYSGSGTYLQSGGSFTGTQAIVGYDGTGSYNLSGGTQALSDLKIGTNSGGNGSYMLSGTAVLTTTQTTVGEFEGTGSFTQSGGTHTVSQLYLGDEIAAGYGANGTYTLQGGVLNANTIDTLRGGTAAFNFTGGTLAVGTFIGNLTNNGGTLAPGASPGMTAVQGDYTQTALGTLAMELGGTGAGLFDTLAVSGTANLGGTLGVGFWNGFNPMAGDSFNLISAQNLLGNFDAYDFAALGQGLTWHVDLLLDQDVLGTDYLRLSVVQSVPVPATAWLLGSGLIGLAGVVRRRTMAA